MFGLSLFEMLVVFLAPILILIVGARWLLRMLNGQPPAPAKSREEMFAMEMRLTRLEGSIARMEEQLARLDAREGAPRSLSGERK